MSNELKMAWGSTTTVISIANNSITNGLNTFEGQAGVTHSTLDNSVLNYPYAKLELKINETFAAAPTAGGTIDVYMVDYDTDGADTAETPVPATSDITYLAKYVGSFIVDNQDVNQIKTIIISLEGVKKARFYILNNSGQTITWTTTASTLKATPFTYAPA